MPYTALYSSAFPAKSLPRERDRWGQRNRQIESKREGGGTQREERQLYYERGRRAVAEREREREREREGVMERHTQNEDKQHTDTR